MAACSVTESGSFKCVSLDQAIKWLQIEDPRFERIHMKNTLRTFDEYNCANLVKLFISGLRVHQLF